MFVSAAIVLPIVNAPAGIKTMPGGGPGTTVVAVLGVLGIPASMSICAPYPIDGPFLLPSSTVAPGVAVTMAMFRFVPDCNAATTAAVISTLTKPLPVAGNVDAGMVARTVGEIVGSGLGAPLKVSLYGVLTACTVRTASVLVFTK